MRSEASGAWRIKEVMLHSKSTMILSLIESQVGQENEGDDEQTIGNTDEQTEQTIVATI